MINEGARKKIRVYVAGAITPKAEEHPVIGFLNNVRRGIRASVELLLNGYAPFSPFIDFLYWLLLKEEGEYNKEVITPEMIKTASLAFLDACDCVFVLPNSEHSEGTKREIKRAIELGKPIFTSMESLRYYYENICINNRTVKELKNNIVEFIFPEECLIRDKKRNVEMRFEDFCRAYVKLPNDEIDVIIKMGPEKVFIIDIDGHWVELSDDVFEVIKI